MIDDRLETLDSLVSSEHMDGDGRVRATWMLLANVSCEFPGCEFVTIVGNPELMGTETSLYCHVGGGTGINHASLRPQVCEIVDDIVFIFDQGCVFQILVGSHLCFSFRELDGREEQTPSTHSVSMR